MKMFIIFIVMCALLFALFKIITYPRDIRPTLLKLVEFAYFEGQRDAIQGDIRIKYVDELKSWTWVKSCWDNGPEPIYNPVLDTNFPLNIEVGK